MVSPCVFSLCLVARPSASQLARSKRQRPLEPISAALTAIRGGLYTSATSMSPAMGLIIRLRIHFSNLPMCFAPFALVPLARPRNACTLSGSSLAGICSDSIAAPFLRSALAIRSWTPSSSWLLVRVLLRQAWLGDIPTGKFLLSDTYPLTGYPAWPRIGPNPCWTL